LWGGKAKALLQTLALVGGFVGFANVLTLVGGYKTSCS